MANTDSNGDREAWLTEAAHLILDERIYPCLPSTTLDALQQRPFRVSVGFPSGRMSKIVAQCWRAAASASGHNEIFVSPIIDDSLEILAALVHELVHYTDDCDSGHRGHFARVARALGLVGPLTATTASADLAEYLQTIVDILGHIPHAKIDAGRSGIRKQGTRMLKVLCPACEFAFRTTKSNIDRLSVDSCCPVCRSPYLRVEDR